MYFWAFTLPIYIDFAVFSCRSNTKNPTDHIVFYFYEDIQGNIIITASFKVKAHDPDHAAADKGKIYPGLNVVSNGTIYKNCINNISTRSKKYPKTNKPNLGYLIAKPNPQYKDTCAECNSNYYDKYGSDFIGFSWYLPSVTNACDIVNYLRVTNITLTNFINSLTQSGMHQQVSKSGTVNSVSGAACTSLKPNKTSFGVIGGVKKYDLGQLQSCGIEVDLTKSKSGFNVASGGLQPSTPVDIVKHILNQLAAGQAI